MENGGRIRWKKGGTRVREWGCGEELYILEGGRALALRILIRPLCVQDLAWVTAYDLYYRCLDTGRLCSRPEYHGIFRSYRERVDC